jgi:hypothetical protein
VQCPTVRRLRALWAGVEYVMAGRCAASPRWTDVCGACMERGGAGRGFEGGLEEVCQKKKRLGTVNCRLQMLLVVGSGAAR